MSAIIKENDRHIYPRWRSFGSTLQLGELARPTIESEIDTQALDLSLAKGVAEWQKDPSLWRGLDLLGTVTIAGKLESFSALVAQIRRNPLAPKFTAELIDRMTQGRIPPLQQTPSDEKPAAAAAREIREYRASLISTPRDPIAWIDLARAYTIVGANPKAARAVLAALQLAPNNRYVLRSAARYLIHVGEKEEARSLLSGNPIAKLDPWIMASEIAISDSIGKPSRLTKLAKERIGADFMPSDLTELASALGSLEAENGNHRNARKLLRQALSGANENSVAQIRWLNRVHLGNSVDVTHANPPLLHEADAWAAFHNGDFDVAKQEALGWLRDQPFASAPAWLSSYIVSEIFMDFQSGKEIALAGLRSNPDDLILLNNLAVCRMELGELEEAEATLSLLKQEEIATKMDVTYKATFGMLEFRKGNHEEGRKLYLEAIEYAKNTGDKERAVRAAFHLVFEELIAHSSHVEEAIRRLKDFKAESGFVEWARFFERVNSLKGQGA
jgi:tetratricopeptide (TPR) repeat protein